MNYLAHLLLAGPDEGLRLGALIGDFMSGMGLEEFPEEIQAGIELHRRVDRLTDAHPAFRQSKARCPAHLQRFAGIIVDVAYDHCLAADWDRWHEAQDLREFTAEVYTLLDARQTELPPRLDRARRWLVGEDWLSRYADVGHLQQVFAGMSRRLKRDNPLAEAADFVAAEQDALAADFARFFPDLRRQLQAS